MDMDFVIICPLVQPDPPLSDFCSSGRGFAIASFRPRLAATPLRIASTSPPSGCAGDLHPQTVEHARRTKKTPGVRRRPGAFRRGKALWQLPKGQIDLNRNREGTGKPQDMLFSLSVPTHGHRLYTSPNSSKMQEKAIKTAVAFFARFYRLVVSACDCLS
jgi:hypothetical protein